MESGKRRERPILFSATMVQAILAGRKTQTRRVVTPQPERSPVYGHSEAFHPDEAYSRAPGATMQGEPVDPLRWWYADAGGPRTEYRCPYGQPGDRLWVRETFYCDDYRYPDGPVDELRSLLEYRASHDCNAWEAGCPCRGDDGRGAWRPSIHMPRWASRLTLEVTEVRVQRLQEISDEDAQTEGLDNAPSMAIPGRLLWRDYGMREDDTSGWWSSPRDSFQTLWQSINGARPGCSWSDNPFVWAITFKKAEG